MSVYKKLNNARLILQNSEIKKSGFNKFANYSYFELGDFLPAINQIFNDIGLCGVVSYAEEIATLTIVDIDDGSTVIITSPMKEANLKGCHPIQNLGAVETYTRRYLWVTALEIVEHDALDSSQPLETAKQELPALKSVGIEDFSDEEQTFLRDTAMEVIAFVAEGKNKEAHDLSAKLDNDEKLAIWGLFDSKTRTAMKKYSQSLNTLKA